MQTVDNLVAILLMNKAIVVVVGIYIRFENCIHKVQRIHRLQQLEIFLAIELANIRLRRIEQHSLLELRRPYHLHFNEELTTLHVLAPYIDYAVLASWCFGNHLGSQIFYRLYLVAFFQRKQGVKQTYDKVGMFAEHLLECQIRLGV